MRLSGALILVLCALVSSVRVEDWRSERDLWGAAVSVSPRAARPALNYGFALLQAGDRQGGVLWLVRAAELARGPRGAEVRQTVRQELRFLSAFGDPVCGRPAVSRHC